MLFATLDPTMRSFKTEGGSEFILSDTVGFVSDLPTELVAAFRATLEEVLSADIILHVRDISHSQSEGQSRDVLSILTNIGVPQDTPLFEIWNKVDKLTEDDLLRLTNSATRLENTFPLSALTGAGIDTLINAVENELNSQKFDDSLNLSYQEGKKRAWLYDQGVVCNETQTEDGFQLALYWSARQKTQFHLI